MCYSMTTQVVAQTQGVRLSVRGRQGRHYRACQEMTGSGKSAWGSDARPRASNKEVATARKQLLCRNKKEPRRRTRKERPDDLYAARAVDFNTEEGAPTRVHRPNRERPHRPTTVGTHTRVHQLRGLPTNIRQPPHTRYNHGRPLGPDHRLGS